MTSIEEPKREEERYRLIAENANDLIGILNKDFKLEYLNEKICLDVLGYKYNEVVGKNILDFVHPSDKERGLNSLTKALEDKEGIIEIRAKHKDGNYIWFEVKGKVFIDNGEPKGILVCRDITSRKKVELELRKSEEKFRSLVETTSDWIWEIDNHDVYTYSNPKVKEILGYEINEIIGKTPFDFMPPNEANRVIEDFQKAKEKKVPIKFIKNKNIHKNGTLVTLETSGVPFYDENGFLLGYRGIDRDITEKVDAEKKLKESEGKFRNIFEAIPDLYFLVSEDTTILDYRGNEQELYVNSEEFLNKKVIDVMPPHIGSHIMEIVRKTIDSKQPQTLEYQLPLQDGKVHFFESRFFYLSKKRVSIFARDITEKKNADKVIYNLAKFPSENPNPVLKVDRDKILYINQAGINLFDSEGGDKIPPLLEKSIKEAFDEKITKFLEVKVNKKIYSFDIIPILKEDYANIYGQDVTKSKNSEAALKTEKHFTEDILNSSLDTIFVFDLETGKALRWNRVFREVSGYSDEEISSMKAPNSYYGEEDLKIASEAIQKIIEEGQTTIELSFITKDGEKIPYEYNATALEDSNGIISVVSIGRNMTERNEAEQKLRESEEKFRNITEQSLMGISVIQDGVFKYFNDRVVEINGYPAEDFKSWGPNEFVKMIHPDDREFVMEQARKKQKGNLDVVNHYPFRIVTKNGDVKWLEIYSKTINYEGSPADLTMTIDITDKIEVEKKLKESEERYRLISEASNTVVWTTDMNLNLTYVSSNSQQVLGYTVEEAIALPLSSVLPQESLEKTARIFKEELRIERKKSKDLNHSRTYETEQIHKNGSIIPSEVTFTFLRDQNGVVNGILGISRDISGRKESERKRINAQKELEKSYERFKEQEKIINKSPGVLFLWKNSEGWPVEFVSENVKQFGYTQEDFYSGKVIYEQIIHPEDSERVFEEISIYSNEDISEFVQEYRIITKSGEIKWLDDRTWIRRDSEGKITHFQGIVIDITDRKITEYALKLSEKNYKDAYDMANFYKDLFTHDMNNILQIINSSAEIISFQLGDSEKSLFIENMTKMIKSQIDRGSKLISDVRTLTSLDEEEIYINRTDLSKFLNNSIKFVKKAYNERNVSIIPVIHEKEYLTNANELLQDVFENILINGIKYNESEIVEIHINISKQIVENKNYTQIEFIDNGIGVPDSKKELIFQPGNREIKGTKGMGIGLSLVSKIMKIFKGKIWVEDKVKGDYSQGSKFIVSLPDLN